MRYHRFFYVLAVTFLLGGCLGLREGEVEPAVLDINLGTEPATLDPARARPGPTLDVLNQLFAGLTRYDHVNTGVLPGLATEWDVSEDGRTYTFSLRENVAWVNQAGDAVGVLTADDVVYTIRRLCHPETDAPFAALLFIIEDCETAYRSTGIIDLEGIGVRAIDERTVEFTLREPAAYFPILMSMWVARPQPRSAIEAYGERWTEPANLLTTGPYLLKEWNPSNRIVFERNPHYYAAGSVQIAAITMVMEDAASATGLYRRNMLDTTALPWGGIQQLGEASEIEQQHVRVPAPCTVSYGFTNTKPPLDNRNVRSALSHAIPRDTIVEELNEAAIPAHHFAPAGIFGAVPVDERGIFTDAQRARELLASAGYPGGQGFPTISLMHETGNTSAAVAETIASAWRRVLGITVQTQSRDREALLALINETVPLEEMPHVWQFEWCSSSLDQHAWLHDAFHCSESLNPLRRLCGTFDTLLEQAAVEQVPAERKDLYTQAEELLALEEAAYAPIFHRAVDVVAKPWVRRNYPLLGGWDIENWQVNMAAKRNARRQ